MKNEPDFKYIGGKKSTIKPIPNLNTAIYKNYIRAEDLNYIESYINNFKNNFNDLHDITDNHISATIASNNTLGHVMVDNNTIKINDNGIISANIPSSFTTDNIKDIISDSINISAENTTSGTTLSWTINKETNSINIEKEKWLSDVNYNSANKTIDFTITNGNTFEIPVSEFIHEYTSKDFKLNELAEKSYNSLNNKPTINGTNISGEISGNIKDIIATTDINKYSAGSGLTLNNDNSFNITKDTNSDSKFLVINNDTIGLSGITDTISNATVARANKLTTAKTISLTGAVVGSASFDGSDNIYITTALNNITINAEDIEGLSISWNDLTDKPSIPTTYSDLTNDTGKVLSTNDYTTTDKNKLEGIEAGAEVNKIESITVNGASSGVSINGKTANITIDIPANSDFTLAGLAEKSYNSLTDKPTINGTNISGEISDNIKDIISGEISGINIGMPIGTIFPILHRTPPEGAYFLDGQVIYNCRELYPDFWNWVHEQAGDIERTPVYASGWVQKAMYDNVQTMADGEEYTVSADIEVLASNPLYQSFNLDMNTYAVIKNSDNRNKFSVNWHSSCRLKIESIELLFTDADINKPKSVKCIINNQVVYETIPSTYTQLLLDSQLDNWFITGENNTTQSAGVDTISPYNNQLYTHDILFEFAIDDEEVAIPDIRIKAQYFSHETLKSSKMRVFDMQTYSDEFLNYGYTGAFGIDENSIRLPSLDRVFLESNANGSEFGIPERAGLPNIEGSFQGGRSSGSNSYKEPTGAFARSGAYDSYDGNGNSDMYNISFNASKSNPIFGNSDTVQPPAIYVGYCIQVFNAATGLSRQESAQLASQMQMKAQTDLANVTTNLDFVVESYYDNAGNWYRKYRSGWIEQGGFCPTGAKSIVNLLQAFTNTNYTLVIGDYIATSNDSGGASLVSLAHDKTTTTFMVSQIATHTTNWYACGF